MVSKLTSFILCLAAIGHFKTSFAQEPDVGEHCNEETEVAWIKGHLGQAEAWLLDCESKNASVLALPVPTAILLGSARGRLILLGIGLAAALYPDLVMKFGEDSQELAKRLREAEAENRRLKELLRKKGIPLPEKGQPDRNAPTIPPPENLTPEEKAAAARIRKAKLIHEAIKNVPWTRSEGEDPGPTGDHTTK